MAALDDVKILIDIQEDKDLDKKLNLIIANAERQVLSYLPSSLLVVPETLGYIVVELAVARFNRIGNEGMSSFSQEGESITYGDDIGIYLPAIQAWNDMQRNDKRRVVHFS